MSTNRWWQICPRQRMCWWTSFCLPQYEHNLGRWAMHQKTDDAFVGWCGLKFRPELDEIDLGYRLHPNYRGRGYASEAALSHAGVWPSATEPQPDNRPGTHRKYRPLSKSCTKIGMQFRCFETVMIVPWKPMTLSNNWKYSIKSLRK